MAPKPAAKGKGKEEEPPVRAPVLSRSLLSHEVRQRQMLCLGACSLRLSQAPASSTSGTEQPTKGSGCTPPLRQGRSLHLQPQRPGPIQKQTPRRQQLQQRPAPLPHWSPCSVCGMAEVSLLWRFHTGTTPWPHMCNDLRQHKVPGMQARVSCAEIDRTHMLCPRKLAGQLVQPSFLNRRASPH